MRKNRVLAVAVLMCAAMVLVALVGCGGNSSSSATSSSASSGSASASGASSASATASAGSASTSASTTAATSSDRDGEGSLINIDGVDVTKISFEMVGDTPNFMVVFSNKTDKDVDVDLTPFKIKVVDGDEVSFHLTHKEVKANTPYSQNAFTASANTMKVGDKVSVFYGDTDLGVFEVAEF